MPREFDLTILASFYHSKEYISTSISTQDYFLASRVLERVMARAGSGSGEFWLRRILAQLSQLRGEIEPTPGGFWLN